MKLENLILLDPNAEPGGGGLSLQRRPEDAPPAPETPPSDGPTAQPFNLDQIFSAPEGAPEGAEPRLYGGRYDKDDQTLTREMIEQNPALAAFVESHYNQRQKIGDLTRGKVSLATPFTEETWSGLDFNLVDGENDQPALPDETATALKKRFGMNDFEFAMMEEMIVGKIVAQRDTAIAWENAADQRIGGILDNVVAWANENKSPGEINSIKIGMQDPNLRDAVVDRLAQEYRAANNLPEGNAPEQPANPLQTGNSNSFQTPTTPANQGSIYNRATMQSDYEKDLLAAGNDAAKRGAVMRKWDRSVQAYGLK